MRSPTHLRPSVLLFDVNETLLDLESLGEFFERVLGNSFDVHAWFDKLIIHAMGMTLADQYTDFFTVGGAVLTMMGEARGLTISDDVRAELGDMMSRMPAHADAPTGLQRLRDNGFRLVAFTNSPRRSGASTPLEHSGLAQFFERQLTVDDMQAFKPAARLYRNAAAKLGVDEAACMMVAAHNWDLLGARGVGMSTALIARPGIAPLVGAGIPGPDLVAKDVVELAAAMENWSSGES